MNKLVKLLEAFNKAKKEYEIVEAELKHIQKIIESHNKGILIIPEERLLTWKFKTLNYLDNKTEEGKKILNNITKETKRLQNKS